MELKRLEELYGYFYIPPDQTELKREIEECHQTLIERMEKPERKLVLKIIDAKDQIAEALSLDSFISGFELAWRLSNELNSYEKERSAPHRMVEEQGALSIYQREE